MYDEDYVQQIIDSIDIVEYISQYIELKQQNSEFFGRCPFHTEDTPSFSVTPSKKLYYCFGCGASGNVINFTQQYYGINFFEALQKIANQYGMKKSNLKISPTLNILRQANAQNKLLPVKHEILSPVVLEQYKKSDIKEWIAEGIPQKIIDKYGVRYDTHYNRIVYPVYDNDNNLINIKGRTLYDDYKKLGIQKYTNYYKVGTADYLQGLNLKKHLILKENEVIVFEGIKSCMKADSFGYYHSVAAETSSLNPYQIRLLLSLKCNIVIAFDNDVPISKISQTLNKLSRFTNVYLIRDKNGILGLPNEKLSPVDRGKEIWEILYREKIKWRGG